MEGTTALTTLERRRVRPGLWHIEGYEAWKVGQYWEVRRLSGSEILFRSASLHGAAEEIAYWVASAIPRPLANACTCGAHYFRGCRCNLTIPEFLSSPHALGV